MILDKHISYISDEWSSLKLNTFATGVTAIALASSVTLVRLGAGWEINDDITMESARQLSTALVAPVDFGPEKKTTGNYPLVN